MTDYPADNPEAQFDGDNDRVDDIVVFWRPGCGYCSGLLREMEHFEVAYTAVNIWQEPEAAAVVRSIARGNETVPTVLVGGAVGLVNPTVHDVLAAAATHAPAAVPEGYTAPEPSRFGKWLGAKLSGSGD